MQETIKYYVINDLNPYLLLSLIYSLRGTSRGVGSFTGDSRTQGRADIRCVAHHWFTWRSRQAQCVAVFLHQYGCSRGCDRRWRANRPIRICGWPMGHFLHRLYRRHWIHNWLLILSSSQGNLVPETKQNTTVQYKLFDLIRRS